MGERYLGDTRNKEVTINLFLNFQGLCDLTNWLDGFRAAGNGDVPGHHELVMHIREISRALQAERYLNDSNK